MNQLISNQDPARQDFFLLSPEERILFRTTSFRVPEGESPETALKRIKSHIAVESTSKPEARVIKHRIPSYVTLVAACVVLLIGLGLIFRLASETSIKAVKGTHSEYFLSDGSAIKINADSKVSFNRRRYEACRKVYLKGEAFFDVTKGISFEVNTPNGNVEVLGTSFNIYSRDNDFRVTCLTGEVRVTSGNSTVNIGPGEKAEIRNGILEKFREEQVNYITGWIDGEFYFENTPLSIVFSEIERQFNVKFAGKERVNEFFTGSFVNNDLKTALDIVCIPMGLVYEINENGRISISSKKH